MRSRDDITQLLIRNLEQDIRETILKEVLTKAMRELETFLWTRLQDVTVDSLTRLLEVMELSERFHVSVSVKEVPR